MRRIVVARPATFDTLYPPEIRERSSQLSLSRRRDARSGNVLDT
jgi:hypothetical protein